MDEKGQWNMQSAGAHTRTRKHYARPGRCVSGQLVDMCEGKRVLHYTGETAHGSSTRVCVWMGVGVISRGESPMTGGTGMMERSEGAATRSSMRRHGE